MSIEYLPPDKAVSLDEDYEMTNNAKIKEPESDMHPDLKWLAENVSEWGGARYVTIEQGGELMWTSKPMNTGDSYCEGQWQAARQQLGLDQPEVTEAEEEAWQAKERSLYGEIKEGFDSLESSRSDGSTASYYELPPGCTELQDLISYRNLNAQDGEIFRAIYRKGRASHSDELRDARKVLFYAKAEVDRLERKCIG